MTDMMTLPVQGTAADLELSDQQSPDQKRKLLLLGGLAAVLVLGVVAYFLLFAGSGASTDEALNPSPPAVAPADAPVPAVDDASEEKSSKARRNSPGHDPFKARIVPPVESTGGELSGVASPVTATDSTAVSGTEGSTTTPTTTTSYRFKVVDVAPDNSTITVKVNGEVYRNLAAGDVFGDVFKVRLISGQVNSFQFGDEIFNVNGAEAITLA